MFVCVCVCVCGERGACSEVAKYLVNKYTCTVLNYTEQTDGIDLDKHTLTQILS